MNAAFAGTPRLIRLALRRDRILLPAWIVSITGIAAAVIASIGAFYTDQAERLSGAAFDAASPMSRMFDGPASGTELGAMTMVEAYLVLGILVALMSAQAVVRHTRQDEETGRAELIGSSVVGRHARLAAAMAVALGTNLVLWAAVTGVLLAGGFPVGGSFAAGLSLAGTGWAFAGIAAITAQIFSTARAANSAAGGLVGVAFLLRAVGDLFGEVAPSGVELISSWPSWLSPLGWGQQVRPFHQNNWDVSLLFLGLTVVTLVVAFWLTSHRDVGSGMVPTRPGPARAPRSLRSGLGLAWRLQRGILLTWATGLVVMSVAFSSVAESVDEVISENEQFRRLLELASPGAGVVELYFTFVVAFVAVAAGGYMVQALLRMRSEEATGRLEPVLATALGRHRWLTGHTMIATAGVVGILALSGLSGGATYGAMTGDWSGTGALVGAATAQACAVLALGGFVVAVFALLPRWSGAIAWAALAASLVMGQLGAILELPQWVLNLSPFTHVPALPAEAFAATPVLILLAAALAFGALGFAAFRRRDLAISA